MVSDAGFAAGDRVHVNGLGTGVVIEVRNANKYLVEIKGRAVVVLGDQIAPIGTKRSKRKPAASAGPAIDEGPTPTHALRALDLHGATALEAQDAVARFLNEALLANVREVQIIHGRSGGRVKAAVHDALRRIASVRFRIDPTNPGVTIVIL
jgi:DNA mismatch repair protein MutS2